MQPFFVGFWFEKIIEVAQQIVNRCFTEMYSCFTSLNPGNINEIINKVQHTFAAFLNEINIPALLLPRKKSLFQELRKAKNTIHRSAYFMTDISKKR